MSAADFVAIDGEAIDGEYCLIASSTGDSKLELGPGGLSTCQSFEFLLSQPRKVPKVCFGLGYDANNWLRDLPDAALVRLWERNVCYWRDFRIQWVPGRWFSVKEAGGRFVEVCEVFGFFQSSFVRALEAWGMAPPAEIEVMKRARGTFTAADRQRIISYCLAECGLLAELMGKVRGACDSAGIMPRKWIGAGSIATALLARESMDRHHAFDLELAGAKSEDAILGAYFGGRVELLRQGVFSMVGTRDLRSAYPAAAIGLPSLEGARLRRRRRFVSDRPGIWRVRWDARGSATQLAPFPARRHKSIFYPLAGEGFYHAAEVAAAIDLGYPVDVLEGWTLDAAGGPGPFEWIRRYYRARAKLKADGDPAEKIVKLGLNSIYGKLAQGYGFNARPRWQSYFWAGQITAQTRASLLRMAHRSTAPIMFATDGIFARRLPSPGRARGIGSWEPGALDRLFAAQPGVYQGLVDGTEILKSRGFFAAEVDYDELREAYELEGAAAVYHYPTHRFIGLGAALGSPRKDGGRRRLNRDRWLRWEDTDRAITLEPERKIVGEGDLLYPLTGPLESEPYEPKLTLVDARALDHQSGLDQPMKEQI